MFKAEIRITLKKTVVDPQGTTIKGALESMGYHHIEDVRIGKFITMSLNIDDKKKCEEKVNEMCRKLLANPIIEDYDFKIEEE